MNIKINLNILSFKTAPFLGLFISGHVFADLSNDVKWNANLVVVEAAIKAGDYKDAFALLQGPAKQGHAKSQYYMGMFYHNGLGVLEDAVEALIAAIYFDGGLENVNKFVSKFIYPNIKELSQEPGKKDYKTRLQEYYAKVGKKVTYENTSTGPDHSKEFNSSVLLNNKVIGSGIGKSKKSAEQMAAKDALIKENN